MEKQETTAPSMENQKVKPFKPDATTEDPNAKHKLFFYIFLKAAMVHFKAYKQDEMNDLLMERDSVVKSAASKKVAAAEKERMKDLINAVKNQHDRITNTYDFVIRKREQNMSDEGKLYFANIVRLMGNILGSVGSPDDLAKISHLAASYREGVFNEFFAELDKRVSSAPENDNIPEGTILDSIKEDVEFPDMEKNEVEPFDQSLEH